MDFRRSKNTILPLRKGENDASGANNMNSNSISHPMAGSYQVTSSKPSLVLESAIHMKITIISLQEDCQGSIDALRKVEEMGPVPTASNMVVLPGDLVVFDPSVISNLCDAHRQGYCQGPSSAIKMSTACTVLLADVGEQDEHGAPLKESAKVYTMSVA